MRDFAQTIGQALETDETSRQRTLIEKSSEIFAGILGNELITTDVEATLELNVVFLKLRHTFKKAKD